MTRLCAPMLAMAIALASASIATSGVVGRSDRDGRSAFAHLCPDALSWTNHPVPRVPPPGPRDAQGVPMIVVDGTRYYRPGALAINGMKRLDAYRHGGDIRQLQVAELLAQRLRELSLHRRRADWLPFWYDYPAAGQRAPWFNAMTQGLVLSFYVRLARATDDPTHLRAAHRIFGSFLRLGPNRRPWVAYVDRSGLFWLEHYPGSATHHVLNAHLHAVFGIYEYWQVTRSTKARRFLRAATATMRQKAADYRVKGGDSLYDLGTRTRITKYHEVHVWQLQLMSRMSGDRYFARLAQGFVSDHRPTGFVPGRPAKLGSRFVGPQCRPARIGGLGG